MATIRENQTRKFKWGIRGIASTLIKLSVRRVLDLLRKNLNSQRTLLIADQVKSLDVVKTEFMLVTNAFAAKFTLYIEVETESSSFIAFFKNVFFSNKIFMFALHLVRFKQFRLAISPRNVSSDKSELNE